MVDVATVLQIIGFAVAQEPRLEGAIRKVLAKPDPTESDWREEAQVWEDATYEKIVPETKLPPETP